MTISEVNHEVEPRGPQARRPTTGPAGTAADALLDDAAGRSRSETEAALDRAAGEDRSQSD
ncbi:MAG: hypothetical protein ACWA6X_03065 [Bauldia sp.]